MSDQNGERDEPQAENEHLAEHHCELVSKLTECAAALNVAINDLDDLLVPAVASDIAQAMRAAGNTLLGDRYVSA